MGLVSVAQAAAQVGVSVPRIHQRIADGSLRAERIGSQWVVDERSLLRIQERRVAGRPLSGRSAWSVIAAAEFDRPWSGPGASIASSRSRMHLRRLLEPAVKRVKSERVMNELAVNVRAMFRNRAQRMSLRAAPADCEDLRLDSRWAMVVDLGASGIASADVEGYIAASQVDRLRRDYLLVDADSDANVVIHVIEDSQHVYPDSRLRLAADLAEHCAPREEARAVQLLHEVAAQWEAAGR